MRKILLTALLLSGGLTASAQYLPNGGFEEWKTTCGKTDQTSTNKMIGKSPNAKPGTEPAGFIKERPGIEPEYWNGSNVYQEVFADMSFGKFKIQMIATGEKDNLVTQGTRDNGKTVKLQNQYVGVKGIAGDNAPAFINLATPWVYAVSTISECDGGVYGGTEFSYRPDAIKGRYKRTSAKNDKNEDILENAHVIAYFWKGTFKSPIAQTGSDGNKSSRIENDVDRAIMGQSNAGTITGDGKLIASCDYTFTSTKNNDWEEIVVPIDYKVTDEVPTKMNVIISSADYWTRNNIQENSILDVDDVQFVYYHALKNFEYDGNVTAITEGQYNYTIDDVYDEKKFDCEKIGVGATVEKSFNEENNTLTVTVKGNDFDKNPESKTVYTFKFKGVTNFTSDLSVELDGANAGVPTPTTIQLINEVDGSYTFQLKNFYFSGIPVGTITLKNLDVDGNKITASQIINIEKGDVPNVKDDEWFGPQLGEVPVNLEATRQGDDLTAVININIGMVIKVVFAPTVEINGTTDFSQIGTGLKNIHFTRTLKKGWNTICLPFNITDASVLGELKAYDRENPDKSMIHFKSAEEFEANEPYLVKCSSEVNDVYFGAEVVEAQPLPRCNANNGFCFQGNYTPSFAMRGRYGVADKGDEGQYLMLGGEGSTLPATGAYFTSNNAKPQSVMIVIDGETTGIDGIETTETGNAAVYDLKGIRVSNGSLEGLPKGLYIKGGKKVYVK